MRDSPQAKSENLVKIFKYLKGFIAGIRIGDSYDNALAETVIKLFEMELFLHLDPRKTSEQLEWGIMKWVRCYNKDRLHEVIGCQTQSE